MRGPLSFSTRIAVSFGGMVLACILLAEAIWYAGLPGDLMKGARDTRLIEATRFLASSANQRLTTLQASIAERRGDLLMLADSDGLPKALASRDSIALQKLITQSLGQLERVHPAAYRQLRVIDPVSGRILASSQDGEAGTQLPQADLLARATQSGVTELVEETVGAQGPTLAVLRQIAELGQDGYPQGPVLGVLMAELDVNAMMVAGIGNDRDGDRQPGVTIVLGEAWRPMARFPEGDESDKAFWRMERRPPGFEGALQLADGHGAAHLAVFRHIPLSDRKSLTLIHYQPVDEALQELQAQLKTAIWMGIGLAMAALSLLLYWARHLTAPLQTLADVAKQLGRGDMNVRAPTGRHDSKEVLALSTAFNGMADSLEANRRSLEEQVAERTKALAEKKSLEERLIHARDMAESANRAKSIFLSNMSHELRTPLNAVLGFAQLMQMDSSLHAEAQDKLTIINRAGRHLLGLIDEVLEISRIESGRSVMTQAPFDLMNLLTSVEEMFVVRAHSKAIAFKADYDKDLPKVVEGDEPHLKQVLINLLGNAVKYTDQGSVTMRARRHEGELEFEVADTGPGISTPDQERIFQPFFQTVNGMAKGEGSGLGLAISQHYAQLMRGRLTVKSEPGQGSVFTLWVPLPSSLEAVVQSPPMRQLAKLEPGHPEVRVLVVDDMADNQELVKQLLEMAHFTVRTASNGEAALEQYQRWQPHCICMDMCMPVMDGYAATRRIRSLPGGQDVKIVALTASAFEEERVAILEAGCDAVLRKPLEADKLIALIGDLLKLLFSRARTPGR